MSAEPPLASALLTAEELARRWRTTPSHVYALARSDALPTVKLGRWRRWRMEDVLAFERAGGTED